MKLGLLKCKAIGLALATVIGCSGEIPEMKRSKLSSAPADSEELSGDVSGSSPVLAEASADVKADAALAPAGAGAAAGAIGGAPILKDFAADKTILNLRRMVMGDFREDQLASVPECANNFNVAREICSVTNETCKSSFTFSCADTGGTCRRLFKCTTGQKIDPNALVYFASGDYPASAVAGIPLCGGAVEHVAGRSCSVRNGKCLSQFGTDVKRVFKCLPAGSPGKLHLRKMGPRPDAELTAAGIPFCAAPANIQGESCTVENSKCKSSFCSDAACSIRETFKCLP